MHYLTSDGRLLRVRDVFVEKCNNKFYVARKSRLTHTLRLRATQATDTSSITPIETWDKANLYESFDDRAKAMFFFEWLMAGIKSKDKIRNYRDFEKSWDYRNKYLKENNEESRY